MGAPRGQLGGRDHTQIRSKTEGPGAPRLCFCSRADPVAASRQGLLRKGGISETRVACGLDFPAPPARAAGRVLTLPAVSLGWAVSPFPEVCLPVSVRCFS